MTAVTKVLEAPLRYGIVKCSNGTISEIEEKPNLKFEILAGIYVLNPEVLGLIPKGAYNMTQLIRDLIDSGENINRYLLEDYWLDIGQMGSYKQAQKDVKEGLI